MDDAVTDLLMGGMNMNMNTNNAAVQPPNTSPAPTTQKETQSEANEALAPPLAPSPSPSPSPQPLVSPPANGADWYHKIASKPKNSMKMNQGKAGKKCTLLIDDKAHKRKKIKFWQEFDKSFTVEGDESNKGIQVATVTDNEFGAALAKHGVEAGWRVTKVGNKELPYKSFAILKNQLLDTGVKAVENKKAYILMFDGNPRPERKEPDGGGGDEKSQVKEVMVEASKNSVELLSGFNDHKVVRIHHSIEKYVEFEAVKGPKGYRISGFKAKFGGDLKAHGVEVGWRILKLGEKDVSEMFTQIIKTNLDVEWRNSKGRGVQITFGKPL